ncbi:MAG: histidine phosphatase family protein [Planctomycetota bacterium]
MIELLLVRHGNTFGPGDRVVWVGRGQDLPLVDKGREQARALAGALAEAGWSPTAALSGGLKRQTEHLDIATGGAPPPERHAALDEVDYGDWGGLTTDEIEARFGADEVRAWNERSLWPERAGWPESRNEVVARVRALAAEIASGRHGERVLACSSNGLLRWFLDLVPGALDAALAGGTFKVGTGRVGRLTVEPGATPRWSVASWNLPPDAPFGSDSSDATRKRHG